jgi:hypothetical protein
MRRLVFCLVMLQGLLLPSALFAATKHPHASTHPAAHRQGAPWKASRAAKKYATNSETLRRAQRRPATLHLAHVETAALIDPVPLGRFPMPAPLKGSHESLLRQNVRSQRDGLSRVEDDADLFALRQSKELVALPATSALVVDERLPANRRYCREWTAEFLSDLSRVHYGRFHRALQVNSAVRTVEYQRHLERVNGNAAPAEGDDASPHLTGATIDIAKKGLSMDEIGWMRAYLAPLQAAGKIDVEEEFYQSCFHITVYRSYRPATPMIEAKAAPTPHHTGKGALLAAQVR